MVSNHTIQGICGHECIGITGVSPVCHSLCELVVHSIDGEIGVVLHPCDTCCRRIGGITGQGEVSGGGGELKGCHTWRSCARYGRISS